MAPENNRRRSKRWLTGVLDKLSRHDGLQLMKILYYGDDIIPERDLDNAKSILEVNDLFKQQQQQQESDSLAVLYYRLGLLVPRYVPCSEGHDLDPSRLREAKDLGAQHCLDYFDECGLPTPSNPQIQSRARFSECFVIAYVNLSPKRRRVLKEKLASEVRVYRDRQLDLFNLFTRLCHTSNEEPANNFMSALNNSEVPLQIFEQVQGQFETHHISHSPLGVGEIQTQEETEEDYYKDNHPLIYQPESSRHTLKIKCTTARAVCVFVTLLPILLFILAVTISTPTLKLKDQSQNQVHMYETWDKVFVNGACQTSDHNDPPLIRLGTMSTQWYDGISITQTSNQQYYYEYKNLALYVVPSDKVVEYSRPYTCQDFDRYMGVQMEIKGIYFLRATWMRFNICICSTDSVNNGSVGMDIYNTKPSFDKEGNDTLNSTRFYISANQTQCYPYNYTAPLDSFYYIRMGANSQRSSDDVKAIAYTLEAGMRYVNESDFLGSQRASCNRTSLKIEKSCETPIKESSIHSFIPLEENYQIFAKVTSPSYTDDLFGHLSIMPIFRKESLAQPTIGGVVFLVPLELILLCIIFVVSKRKQRRRTISDAEELGNAFQN